MKIEKTEIEGVYIITPKTHEDERGFFMESYREDVFRENGINVSFIQDNHSLSLKKNTIRGLHFQYDKPMAKLMRVTRGSAFIVAVDIRKNSPTFGKYVGIECSAENKKQMYAEAGFARGFQTLEDMTEVQYKVSAFFNKDSQGEIAWDDNDINIKWPIDSVPIVSEKNKKSPSLKDWCERGESDMFKV